MAPQVFRSGKIIRFRWIGAGLLVIGVVVTQNSQTHRRWASRGYLTRGQTVVDAHRESIAGRTARG